MLLKHHFSPNTLSLLSHQPRAPFTKKKKKKGSLSSILFQCGNQAISPQNGGTPLLILHLTSGGLYLHASSRHSTLLLSLWNWPLKSIHTVAHKWPLLRGTLGGGRPSQWDHWRITYSTCSTCKFCTGYMRKRVAVLLPLQCSLPNFIMTWKHANSQTLNSGNIIAFHHILSFKKERKEKEETKPNQTNNTICFMLQLSTDNSQHV